MILAREIFKAYRWANYITKDDDGYIFLFEEKPVKRRKNWVAEGQVCPLGYVEVAEFAGNTDNLIERKKFIEFLKWMESVYYGDVDED